MSSKRAGSMNHKKVICLGGEGDPATIGYAMLDANRRGYVEWEFAGFLNDRIPVGTQIQGFPVLGKLDEAQRFLADDYYFINAIYRIDGNRPRIARFESLAIPDERLATFVHPTAVVAPGVEIGPGCAIMPLVGIAPGVALGKGCVVLQHAVIGHDTVVSDHCHIAAQACIGSHCRLGVGVHIGMNATIMENRSIGDHSTLGMASALTRDIGNQQIWFGVPARYLRKPNAE